MDMLTFNEALNVIASERPRVNLLSFTIRQHGALRLFSRNQSAGGLHLISSYVTPCKQRIQSCDAETTFPRVQNWKIPPPREEWLQHHRKGTEKNDRGGPCYYRVSTKGSRTTGGWNLSSLSLYLVSILSRFIVLARCIALSVFSSVLKRGHLWHRALFSQGGSNLKGNLCVRKNDRDYR